MTGIIKFFTEKDGKNFGFIIGEDGVERFFHLKDWISPGKPAKGASVTHEIMAGKKGDIATKIKLL